MEMRKQLKGHQLHMALLICLTLILGLAGASFAAHPEIKLLDQDGNPILAGASPQAAYSAKQTCGSCHTYENIEKHSYHAQIGANELVGWNSWNPDSSNKYLRGVATKGKSWVQSPGHVGKW
jgi:hypothetical protein